MSLSHACLLELRDRLHMPEGFMIAAGADQLGRWLDQLDAAIDAGKVDQRPSSDIEEAERAARVASLVLARLPSLLVELDRCAAVPVRPIFPPLPPPVTAEAVATLVAERMREPAFDIAAEVLRRLGPATRAEFITPGNAEAVTGQDFRWVKAEAKRLGVAVGGTGHKRVVDVEAFRAALAAEAKPQLAKCAADPVEQIRLVLGSTRLNGAKHGD